MANKDMNTEKKEKGSNDIQSVVGQQVKAEISEG
jgi:hypothetical protein